jgi:hypothetical protein
LKVTFAEQYYRKKLKLDCREYPNHTDVKIAILPVSDLHTLLQIKAYSKKEQSLKFRIKQLFTAQAKADTVLERSLSLF